MMTITRAFMPGTPSPAPSAHCSRHSRRRFKKGCKRARHRDVPPFTCVRVGYVQWTQTSRFVYKEVCMLIHVPEILATAELKQLRDLLVDAPWAGGRGAAGARAAGGERGRRGPED